MQGNLTRRGILEAAGAAVVAGAATGAAASETAGPGGTIKILAISTSPRKGKTTAAGLRICLDAAKAVDPRRIETELIELAGMNIDAGVGAGLPSEPGRPDDFPALLSKLTDPRIAGVIIGSPVYMGNMSYLCGELFARMSALRKTFSWSNKVGGALAVAGARNGGQENVLRSIHATMFGEEMIVVGDGRPTAHCGATLWNNGKDDVSHDEPGIATAKNLGRRVAEVALRFAHR
jgi:multimeric flavodoxin WrbA